MRRVVIFMFALTAPLNAQQTVTIFNMKTGDQLKTECFAIPDPRQPETIVSKMSCVSYVTAIADLVENLRVVKGYPKPFCLPRDLIAERAVDTVKLWMSKRQPVAMPASQAVVVALSENFPCN